MVSPIISVIIESGGNSGSGSPGLISPITFIVKLSSKFAKYDMSAPKITLK